MNKENVIVKIYELRDPRDPKCSPRYVGITSKSLKYRLEGHIYNSIDKRRKLSYKINWIKKLTKVGIVPTIHLIEEVVGWNYAYQVEKYWIKEFKEQGYNLTNATDGGKGSLNFKHSEETINLLSNKIKDLYKNGRPPTKICKLVYQYDLNGKFIKRWDSLTDVANYYKVSKATISACCRDKGKTKKSCGFIFSYNKQVIPYKNNNLVRLMLQNLETNNNLIFDSVKSLIDSNILTLHQINILLEHKISINNNIHKKYKLCRLE